MMENSAGKDRDGSLCVKKNNFAMIRGDKTARQARKRSSTGYYHIMMRGNNRACIFEKREAKAYFLKILFKLEEEESMDLVAWCIMDNHVHLVVKVDFENLEGVLKRLNVSFAIYHNNSYKKIGHVFQDRAKSEPLETEESLTQLSHH